LCKREEEEEGKGTNLGDIIGSHDIYTFIPSE